MSELQAKIESLRRVIAAHRGKGLNEADTKAKLISPLLRVLGWNPENYADIRLEHRVSKGARPVDYALFDGPKLRLIIEAKALSESLEDPAWTYQVIMYAAVAVVEWVVLTNGDEYRILNALAKVPTKQKVFRTVRLSDSSGRPEETLILLEKERLRSNPLDELWRTEFLDREVLRALSDLFTPAPSQKLVNLVRKKVAHLSSSETRASLARVGIRFGFPLEEDGGRPDDEEVEALPPKEVEVSHLIDAGLIKPPLDLVRRYKGKDLVARIEADGHVMFQGERFSSLSAAGGRARASVLGKRSGESDPSTNGWSFWRFRDEAGSVKQIGALRERLRGTGAGQPTSRAENALVSGGGKEGEISPKNRAYQRFFQTLIDRLRDEHEITNARTAQPQSWYAFASGVRGFDYGACFGSGARMRTELFIHLGDEKTSRAALEQLRREAAPIEHEFGEKLEWEPLDGKKSCRIATYRPGSIKDPKEKLDEHVAWAVDRLLRFKKVFGGRLPTLAGAKG